MANAATPSQKWGNPDSKSFEANYMTVMKWYDSMDKQTHKLYCHKLAAPHFKAFLEELSHIYDIKIVWCYNNRSIRGSTRKSQHAYGNAIDINPDKNPMGSKLITDMPIKEVTALAKKHNLDWGALWSGRKDAMHFEYRG
jgi:hypothetical protein